MHRAPRFHRDLSGSPCRRQQGHRVEGKGYDISRIKTTLQPGNEWHRGPDPDGAASCRRPPLSDAGRPRSPKVGLALGGGGARGCAHIGVINALSEAGVPIHAIAGTSIGAVIGAVYSAGDWKAFSDFLLTIKWNDVIRHFDPVIPKRGFFDGEKIKTLLKDVIPDPDFSRCRIPFAATATDLYSGREVILRKGDLIEALRASISIPGIFTPARIGTRYLVDGGVINPLPVTVARRLGADIVVAVDLNHYFVREKRTAMKFYGKKSWLERLAPTRPNILDVIENSIFLMQDQLTKNIIEKNAPEYLVRPELRSAGIFDFHQAESLIEEGYRKTQPILPDLLRRL